VCPELIFYVFLDKVAGDADNLQRVIVQKLDVHGVFDQDRPVDAERVHHAYCVHQRAVDNSTVFQGQNQHVSVVGLHQAPL